jgi:thiamine-phosphate diphosphorylase / hydroxyethylthiazole kinase
MKRRVGTVSISLSNVRRVIYESQANNRGLDGVAIVSAIMGADDPKTVAAEFSKLFTALPAFVPQTPVRVNDVHALLSRVPHAVRRVATERPLVHSMINFVAANFAANAALCM